MSLCHPKPMKSGRAVVCVGRGRRWLQSMGCRCCCSSTSEKQAYVLASQPATGKLVGKKGAVTHDLLLPRSFGHGAPHSSWRVHALKMLALVRRTGCLSAEHSGVLVLQQMQAAKWSIRAVLDVPRWNFDSCVGKP